MDWSGQVVLVRPPLTRGGSYYLSAPTALLVVAAALEKIGLEPVVVDMALETAESSLPLGNRLCQFASERLAAMEADIYGFSVQCVNLPIALAIARRLKKLTPRSRIVFGGHHVSLVGALLRQRFPFVDEALTGRIESQVPGTNGGWLMPAYQLSPSWTRYSSVCGQSMGIIEAARGCPYECRFCSVPVVADGRIQYKPIEMVLKEASWWRQQACDRVYLVGDTLTVDRKHSEALGDALTAARLGLHWGATTRVDLVSYALLAKLSQAGCQAILYGVESVDARTRTGIRKGEHAYPNLLTLVQWHLVVSARNNETYASVVRSRVHEKSSGH